MTPRLEMLPARSLSPPAAPEPGPGSAPGAPDAGAFAVCCPDKDWPGQVGSPHPLPSRTLASRSRLYPAARDSLSAPQDLSMGCHQEPPEHPANALHHIAVTRPGSPPSTMRLAKSKLPCLGPCSHHGRDGLEQPPQPPRRSLSLSTQQRRSRGCPAASTSCAQVPPAPALLHGTCRRWSHRELTTCTRHATQLAQPPP